MNSRCRHCRFAVLSLVALLLGTSNVRGEDAPVVEGFQVGAERVNDLPKGKEADGIKGDFVLRNRYVEALVSGNLEGRKANMTTKSNQVTPGTVYDLSVRGSDNDQLTLFAPGDQDGQLSKVELEADGGNGRAMVYAHRTPARGGGKEVSHIYWLEPEWRHLLVLSHYELHSGEKWKLTPKPFVKGLRAAAQFGGIHFADAQNPTDRQGYAWAPISRAESSSDWKELELKKGERRSYAMAIAPGTSPAEAYGVIAGLVGAVGRLEATIHGDSGDGVATATLSIRLDDKTTLPAYPNDAGELHVDLPPGTYTFSASDIGRSTRSGEFTVREGETTQLDVPMDVASRVEFDLAEADAPDAVFPCKAQFIGIAGTENPMLGVDVQAHGCRNQYHSESGRFGVQVPPGEYLVVITRGIEFEQHTVLAVVALGTSVKISRRFRRLVDTTGWVSTDFHNHSTPSGDNYCGTNDRIINLAAEHIEFAPTTEHNRLYDWTPHIEKLGLADAVKTIVGIELTGSGAHFNAFPLKVVPWVQDGGAPVWQKDPRINAIVLRDFQGGGADRYVQINHPNVGAFFRDRNEDGIPDGGYVDLESLIDAAEVWSTEILNPRPWLESGRANRTFAWLQLLNQGRNMFCVAVSDAHSVFGNGVGSWRTYIPSHTDAPGKIDPAEIIRNAKAGRMIVTNGPFLEVELEDGTTVGGHTIASGSIGVRIKVQCTNWIDVDRVQILVNGRQIPSLNFTRANHADKFSDGAVKFEQLVEVPLTTDAHIIVAAVGEGSTLETGYGESWQSEMHPVAFTNPIFVDHDGNGFRANGDTLGHPLPVGKKL